MHDAHAFLQNLALVLCVAAVTTVLFQKLKQPVVFGYLLAGMIVGPHVPIPLVADQAMVQTLSELGVVLLMFALGMEFNLRKVFQVGPTAGLVAIAEVSAMMWIGFVLGQLFGWTLVESVFAGAIFAISSTTIIVKAFEEQRVRGRFTEVVLGILIFEDLLAIFLLTILTALSTGVTISATSLAVTGLRLVIFLAVLIGVGLLLVPRIVRAVVRIDRPETTLVVSMGICFAAALAALAFGYSVALGAFIAGALVAESGEEKKIEHLITPVRDMFVAIFFIAVGMMIDPGLVARHWVAILVFTLALIAGKVVAVTMSSFLTGYTPRTSIQAGMSLAQIGEFSFIIAGVGLSSGATREFLYPIAVAVSAITTLTTPWLIRASAPAASWVDRKLPHPVQTFTSLYGSWIERLRSSSPVESQRSRTRRLARLMLLDAALIVALIIATALEIGRVSALLSRGTGMAPEIARLIVLSGAIVVGVPLVVGLVRTARLLGVELATKALPSAEEGKVDFAAAPRRALVVTLQLALVFAAAFPIVALTQPFLPPLRLLPILLALAVLLGVAFWRSTTNLHGHARAGAEVIVAALANQMAGDESDRMGHTVEHMHRALPGLGEPVPLRIPPGSPAANRSLSDLNLRGVTGATVLAILREGEQVVVPLGREIVREGDVLALAGTQDAIAAARVLVGLAEDSRARPQ
jgi:monovalent cation:H+ antiporter-2, CPA2 family